jgi:hypothetical protein
MWRVLACLFFVLTLGASTSACGTPGCDISDEGNPPSVYDGGITRNGYYATSTSHGGLLYFPGGKRYDIVHHLGFEPMSLQLFWSFKEAGIGIYEQTNDTGTLAPAAGNSAEIQLKNDQFIRVKNDSCVEYWLLLTAFGDPRDPDGGGGTVGDAAAE